MGKVQFVTRLVSYRKNTEDRAAVHSMPEGLVAIIADGAGGIAGGATAADRVLMKVQEALNDKAFRPYTCLSWVKLLRSIDASIAGAGETTAVVIAISDTGSLVGASCGDSEAIIISKEGAMDDLTQGQQRKKRLESGKAEPAGFERGKLQGTLLMGTDGLFGYVPIGAIAKEVITASDLEQAGDNLVEKARSKGGKLMDDLGIILIRGLDG